MADFSGLNKVKGDDSNIKIPASDYYGKIRVICEEFELSAALAIGDKIVGPELPQGAKIIGGTLKADDMGATGIFNLGTRLSDDNGITEVSAGVVSQADAGGQSVLKKEDKDSSLIGSKIAEGLNKKSELLISVTEATANAAGKIQAFIFLSVE